MSSFYRVHGNSHFPNKLFRETVVITSVYLVLIVCAKEFLVVFGICILAQAVTYTCLLPVELYHFLLICVVWKEAKQL